MSILKARSIIRTLKTLRHPPTTSTRKFTSPASYLSPKTLPKPPQNPFSSLRRFSTYYDPENLITVPPDRAYVIRRNGKYLKTLPEGDHYLEPDIDEVVHDYCVYDEFPIKISTSGTLSSDESWEKGKKLGMELEATIIAEISDPDLAFNCNWNVTDFDLSKDDKVREILQKTIMEKIIPDRKIPRLIQQSRSEGVRYEQLFEEKMELTPLLYELNKEVLNPRYGLECVRFGQFSWYMSPALIDRLFGMAKWHKEVDSTITAVKSVSEEIVKKLEDLKTLEHKKGEEFEVQINRMEDSMSNSLWEETSLRLKLEDLERYLMENFRGNI